MERRSQTVFEQTESTNPHVGQPEADFGGFRRTVRDQPEGTNPHTIPVDGQVETVFDEPESTNPHIGQPDADFGGWSSHEPKL